MSLLSIEMYFHCVMADSVSVSERFEATVDAALLGSIETLLREVLNAAVEAAVMKAELTLTGHSVQRVHYYYFKVEYIL